MQRTADIPAEGIYPIQQSTVIYQPVIYHASELSYLCKKTKGGENPALSDIQIVIVKYSI